MGFVVPNSLEVEIITEKLTPALTLRLYGNNVTPSGTSSPASFTEISGGGYAAKAITFANWTIVSGNPSYAIYALQTWTFTSTIGAPGSIYGYYITRNSDGNLILAERFPAANVPFAPQAGSIIRVLPRFAAQSEF